MTRAARDFLSGLLTIGAMMLAFAAWLTHIFVCLKAGLWAFLLAGAICVPIGVIHGWLIWFGIV